MCRPKFAGRIQFLHASQLHFYFLHGSIRIISLFTFDFNFPNELPLILTRRVIVEAHYEDFFVTPGRVARYAFSAGRILSSETYKFL